jgi:hypothetical protein
MQAPPVLVINPLKSTLAHYELALTETLRSLGFSTVETYGMASGDGVTGAATRVWIALRTVMERVRMGHSVRGRIVIVVWPLFGYFEPLTLLALARSNRVFVVVHDPSPLRKAYGQSWLARRLFKALADRRDILILYHTKHAQRVGNQVNGITGDVVPHPVRMTCCDEDRIGSTGLTRPIVRVLGQHKQTRSLAALKCIAVKAGGTLTLEIHGRGWPAIPGWNVVEGFVSEEEFSALVRTSDCVVIPYGSFFQSGVAARCLEAGVGVVAPRHEHIAELYGNDWPGMVRKASDWHEAVLRVLAVDSADIRVRRAHVCREVQRGWEKLLRTSLPSSATKRNKMLSDIGQCIRGCLDRHWNMHPSTICILVGFSSPICGVFDRISQLRLDLRAGA